MKDSKNSSCTWLVLFLLSQFCQFIESTCWIGSVGAEGDSGCEVDAALEHSLDSRRGAAVKQSMVIRSVLAVTRPPRPNRGHSTPFHCQLPRVTCRTEFRTKKGPCGSYSVKMPLIWAKEGGVL